MIISTVLPDVKQLWDETLGDPRVCIAVLDGPVDTAHPCLRGALISSLPTLVTDVAGDGPMAAHGTHVTSMIFGRAVGGVVGVAPACRGLNLPIYTDEDRGSLSQVDLARAINQAVEAGAHVINVSGGEFSNNGGADPTLINAVQYCKDQGVLLVAAAGNEGCRCLHVPAALPSVLAVGASDHQGRPLEATNWGDAYQLQGVLVPGFNMLGATPGGGVAPRTGTSFATPVLTGVVALFLSLQLKRGIAPDPYAVRQAILKSAIPCRNDFLADGQRCLRGRLNIPGAYALIFQSPMRVTTMFDESASEAKIRPSAGADQDQTMQGEAVAAESCGVLASEVHDEGDERFVKENLLHGRRAEGAAPSGLISPAASSGIVAQDNAGSTSVRTKGVVASDCSCNRPLARSPIFAIGVLGYDFGTEARRDSFRSLMPNVYATGYPFHRGVNPDGSPIQNFAPNPYDPRQLVNYLAGYPRPQPPFPSSGGFPKPKSALPAFPPEDPPVPSGYPDEYPGLEASPWDAAELIWTLNIELTPIYAIRPSGGFAAEAYQKLITFLDGQTRNPVDDRDYVERVSIPGYLSGETVRLFSGQVVPVLVPNVRGMFGWNTVSLIEAVKASIQTQAVGANEEEEKEKEDTATERMRSFLDRIYFDLRNLGQTPQERALNYSVTNAFQAATILLDAVVKEMELDSIDVDRSPFCRKDSDCWDVKLRFFNPDNVLKARHVSRYTVDVSDAYPVLVGPIRTWNEAPQAV